MASSKTWPGGGTNTTPAAFSIPAAGELNWASLSDFLNALGDSAQSTTLQKWAVRKALTSPVTVSATTDCVVVTDLTVAGAVTVNLPAGATKQVFVVVDGKGDAGTNNITINRSGGDTIAGSTSLVLNTNREGVVLVYNATDTDWKIGLRTRNSASVVSSDNALARFDGTGGSLQNSGVTLDDSNNLTVPVSSNLTADSPTFFVDGANHRVGVGTFTPSAILQTVVSASGSIADTAVFQNTSNTSNSASRAIIRAGGPSAGDCSLWFDTQRTNTWSAGVDISDSEKFKITLGSAPATGATTKLTLNTSGQMGLGTEAPADTLDIAAGGVRFASGGTSLSYYEENSSFTSTFTSDGTSPGTSGALTFIFVRVGKLVTLRLDFGVSNAASFTAGTGATFLKSSTAFPSQFRPAEDVRMLVQVENNTGSPVQQVVEMRATAAGLLEYYPFTGLFGGTVKVGSNGISGTYSWHIL